SSGTTLIPGTHPAGFEVAIAVGRERLAEEHFKQAMAFIEFTQDDLAPPRALGIYARLHHLAEEDYRVLKNRVLASFGSTVGEELAPPTFTAINGDVEWDITASLFNRIRKRLGGRRNYRLRKRVELFSGRVECTILRVHVDSVCRLIKLYDENTSVADVLRVYMEELEIRGALYHSIYNSTLDRLYDELEPAAVIDEPADEQLEASEKRPLLLLPGGRRSG
ncbi:MAG: hypothetical protein ACREMQ_14060, partial [Longimicrobiales bacterium]